MDRHLITVDELRAAGALDVPEAWRKSLRVERDLISGLFADEDAEPETRSLLQSIPTTKQRQTSNRQQRARNPASASVRGRRPASRVPGTGMADMDVKSDVRRF